MFAPLVTLEGEAHVGYASFPSPLVTLVNDPVRDVIDAERLWTVGETSAAEGRRLWMVHRLRGGEVIATGDFGSGKALDSVGSVCLRPVLRRGVVGAWAWCDVAEVGLSAEADPLVCSSLADAVAKLPARPNNLLPLRLLPKGDVAL